MRDMMRRVFKRAGTVGIMIGGKKLRRRGIVRPLALKKEDISPFEILRAGKLSVPLSVYYGDAEELLDAQDAELEWDGETYRVLRAEKIMGLSVRAILERREADDGN